MKRGSPVKPLKSCFPKVFLANAATCSTDVSSFSQSPIIGRICTSSNARQSLEWAFEQGERIFFLPDQHLGRNTAVLDLGLSLEDCVVYDPHKPGGGLTDEQMRASKVVLWRGHCSVHGRFTEAVVDEARERIPGVNILVHPECRHEVVQKADYVGSTEYIIKVLDAAEPGSAWAIGTELNLVRRLANAHPDKQITFLDRSVCYCSTMNRIDLPHLVWALENLVAGNVVNQIVVDADTSHWARVALDRMLALPGVGADRPTPGLSCRRACAHRPGGAPDREPARQVLLDRAARRGAGRGSAAPARCRAVWPSAGANG